MASNLERRVRVVEGALNESGGLTIIHIKGGFDHETAGDRAEAGGMTWTREDGEEPLAFRARCEIAARLMGANILIFGGPKPTTWSAV
jgi:hypothetical protein